MHLFGLLNSHRYLDKSKHLHLIYRAKARYDWTSGIPALATGDFTMADYLALTAGLGVAGSVFMEAGVDDADHPGAVTSPMVGVAYLSSEPTAAPFVTVGSKVAQGQTLLLIEAMKTYNQIKAPRAGTVTRILVESGMPVEFGEPLLIIE